ncbi:WD domain, G-beta repeat [Seminavis robusta]|uniref:WD domain, G-beta repeat n=1 Tax=Seminavis robusta TaxID=568900 RepID=A0A9N8EWQ6_9STRA|nr:WD domain, G-beta repeat [Seminavis robusta]|eukprot:Sro2248_g320680.1 WD domain, G-beta repeat (448) ;mRNA; r:5048-6391
MTRGIGIQRAVVLFSLLAPATSFLHYRPQQGQRSCRVVPPQAVFSEDNEFGGRFSMESLRSRQAQLESAKFSQEKKWRDADCESGVRVSLTDWVRRLDVQYPLAACGTSSSTIYLCHLETGEILAKGARRPDTANEIENLDKALYHMYGEYDGGGTVAIAFHEDLICEASRDGSVHFWRLDAGSARLVYQGAMKALEGTFVTDLKLDDEFLWVASADGKLRAFPLDSNMPLALQTQPELEWQFSSMLISLSLTPDIGCGVVTTVGGTVELISLENDGRSLCSFYPPYDDDDEEHTSVHAMCAQLVAHEEDEDGELRYSIAVGGNDGSLILQPIQLDEDGEVDEYRPFMGSLRRFKPRHKGPVKCVANPIPGMLISASEDGSMRVWDIEQAHCLYQFVGYKVWMGSLWTDGSRIVSDGSDNTIIVHDFKKQAGTVDMEEDDMEEDSWS